MFGVLIIILGSDRIAGALRIAGELQVFLSDVGRCPRIFTSGPLDSYMRDNGF